MRYDQNGLSLWYGTPDAPAPEGDVLAAANGRVTGLAVTVAVHPIGARNTVEVRYRVNGGGGLKLQAPLAHIDVRSNAQYFIAHLPEFRVGDRIDYIGVTSWPGGQVPTPDVASTFPSSFRVVAAGQASTANPGPINPQPTIEPPNSKEVKNEPQGAETGDFKETLKAVLHASSVLKSAALEDSFTKLYFGHGGDTQSFWTEVEKHPDLKPYVGKLQFVLQIDLLAAGHLPLIEAVFKTPGIQSMRDLAHLDDAVWHGLIEKSGIPHDIPGSSPEAKAKFYAHSILAILHAGFPNTIVWRIASASHHVDPLAAKFIENSPDFDIRTTRVDVYADQHQATAFKGIAEAKREAVIKEVKRLQRLFAVSTNSNAFRALLETRFDSAHAIAAVPRATFTSHYAHLFGGTVQAAELHERAQFINARNLHLRLSVHDAIQTPATRGLGHHSHSQMLRTYSRHGRKGSHPDTEHEALKHLKLWDELEAQKKVVSGENVHFLGVKIGS